MLNTLDSIDRKKNVRNALILIKWKTLNKYVDIDASEMVAKCCTCV